MEGCFWPTWLFLLVSMVFFSKWMTAHTHQYQSLASNTNGSVKCSVSCVILYGDVSATLQQSVNNPELFCEDGRVKRSFTWPISIINPWKKKSSLHFLKIAQRRRGVNSGFWSMKQLKFIVITPGRDAIQARFPSPPPSCSLPCPYSIIIFPGCLSNYR